MFSRKTHAARIQVEPLEGRSLLSLTFTTPPTATVNPGGQVTINGSLTGATRGDTLDVTLIEMDPSGTVPIIAGTTQTKQSPDGTFTANINNAQRNFIPDTTGLVLLAVNDENSGDFVVETGFPILPPRGSPFSS